MLYSMSYDLLFNRVVNNDTDYISPGGFEVLLSTGEKVPFDFLKSSGNISGKHVTFYQRYLDTASFPDAVMLNLETIHQIEQFTEFFVYLGEENESPDLHPIKVSNLELELIDEKGNVFQTPISNKQIPKKLFFK